jgi:hypothetical protein
VGCTRLIRATTTGGKRLGFQVQTTKVGKSLPWHRPGMRQVPTACPTRSLLGPQGSLKEKRSPPMEPGSQGCTQGYSVLEAVVIGGPGSIQAESLHTRRMSG